jgi:hypothetical protein
VFKEAEVIIELLPGDPEATGKPRGGIRLLERPEDPEPSRIEETPCGAGLLNDVEGSVHGE